MLGRWISADEDVKGGPRNIVMSYPFWRDFLGGDPHVLGKSIRLSGNAYAEFGELTKILFKYGNDIGGLSDASHTESHAAR